MGLIVIECEDIEDLLAVCERDIEWLVMGRYFSDRGWGVTGSGPRCIKVKGGNVYIIARRH